MRLSVTYREGRTWVIARPDSKRSLGERARSNQYLVLVSLHQPV